MNDTEQESNLSPRLEHINEIYAASELIERGTAKVMLIIARSLARVRGRWR
jgi:hypothetical protein